jgi:hypothetical protein
MWPFKSTDNSEKLLKALEEQNTVISNLIHVTGLLSKRLDIQGKMIDNLADQIKLVAKIASTEEKPHLTKVDSTEV